MPAGKKWVSWWVSRVSLCTADAATLQPLSCSDYDPRSWRDEECMWSAGFESLGEESWACQRLQRATQCSYIIIMSTIKP
jgi:hypothetical protein